jgi:soluble lytic murein transglycosylase-like protein
MSYSDAVHRVSDLRERLGLADANITRIEPGNFDKVLASAHSRFEGGPSRLDVKSNELPGDQWPPTTVPSVTSSTTRGAATKGLTPALTRMIDKAADRYGVPKELLTAVARAESGFRSDAVSPAGARGLMQLMPATAKDLGVGDSFDPLQNLQGGAKYLKQLLGQFHGDVKLALAGYNAGPGNVQRYGGIPPFPETRAYVARVLGYAGELGFNP